MGKIVIELRNDILNNNIDILSILRKAKLIAVKLDLSDFEKWINCELNGYKNYEDIPSYRTIYGEIKAKNPINGYIPVQMPSSLERKLNNRKIYDPISKIIDLSQKNRTLVLTLPTEISDMICCDAGVYYPCYIVFIDSQLVSIIESVKNYLLDWCLKLEKDGIVGENMEFDEYEINKAKNNSQLISYYQTIITGNINESQILFGNNNSVFVQKNLEESIKSIKEALLQEEFDHSKKNEAIEKLEDIEKSVKEHKKPSFIKGALNVLKDFLIDAGASITADLITKIIYKM